MTPAHRAVAQAAERLAGCGIADARLEAEVLARHALGYDRATYFASLREPLDAARQARIERLVGRRAQGEPLAYITGHREFYGLDFIVNPAVLIPRQETELLVDKALEWAAARASGRGQGQGHDAPLIADVGTGSGAIAVALAYRLPRARICAIDASAAALAVADRNRRRHGVAERVALMQGDLLTAVKRGVDAIVSNPPYIASGLLSGLPRDVRREPALALDGGQDGLRLTRRLIAQAARRLNRGGLLLAEIAPEQAGLALGLAQAAFPGATTWVAEDGMGRARCVGVDAG